MSYDELQAEQLAKLSIARIADRTASQQISDCC